jgi:FSR family fosmidomycin resistance protein-like MFS transporter
MNIPRQRLFWAVALGHLTNDTFMSMVPVLLTFISVNILPLTTTQIGTILGIMALVGALSQPLFGWIADRNGGRWLGAGGVAWTVTMFLLAMLAAEQGLVALMGLAFVIPAFGSGAFHPVGTKYASESNRHHAASNLAYFFLMGQLGLALGPALSGRLLDNASSFNHVFTDILGPSMTGKLIERGSIAPVFLVGIFALPAIILMALTLPTRREHQSVKQARSETARSSMVAIPVFGLLLLIAMVALRSLGQPGAVNFIPVLFQQKGWSPAQYGLITSFFWIGSGLAGVYFGHLADTFDSRKVIGLSMIASAPAFFLLPLTDGGPAFALAIAAGVLSGASHSIIVSLAHDLMPGSKALASGMILGLIFGMGAVGNLLIGWLADTIGLAIVFQLVAAGAVIAGLMAFALPRQSRSAPITAEIAPETQGLR